MLTCSAMLQVSGPKPVMWLMHPIARARSSNMMLIFVTAGLVLGDLVLNIPSRAEQHVTAYCPGKRPTSHSTRSSLKIKFRTSCPDLNVFGQVAYSQRSLLPTDIAK
jgi:hypothetical protein